MNRAKPVRSISYRQGYNDPEVAQRSQTTQGVEAAWNLDNVRLTLPSSTMVAAPLQARRPPAHCGCRLQDNRLRPPLTGLLRVESPHKPRWSLCAVRTARRFPLTVGWKGIARAAEPETNRIRAIEVCTLCPLQPLRRRTEGGRHAQQHVFATRTRRGALLPSSFSSFAIHKSREVQRKTRVRKVVSIHDRP